MTVKFIIDANKDPVFARNLIIKENWWIDLEHDVIVWLNENCPNWKYNGTITLRDENITGLSFTFENENDIIGFKLRWS